MAEDTKRISHRDTETQRKAILRVSASPWLFTPCPPLTQCSSETVSRAPRAHRRRFWPARRGTTTTGRRVRARLETARTGPAARAALWHDRLDGARGHSAQFEATGRPGTAFPRRSTRRARRRNVPGPLRQRRETACRNTAAAARRSRPGPRAAQTRPPSTERGETTRDRAAGGPPPSKDLPPPSGGRNLPPLGGGKSF